jgi:hypothetical protein
MNTLIKKLLMKAVGHYAAHNHNWSEGQIVTMVVMQKVGNTQTVHTKKVEASYCEQCSAIRYRNEVGTEEVFIKMGEPNLYCSP